MFQVVARHCEPIFCILTCLKCDLGKVDYATFQVVAVHCALIFCLLTSPEFCLGEFGKDVSRGRLALRSHFLPTQNVTWIGRESNVLCGT